MTPLPTPHRANPCGPRGRRRHAPAGSALILALGVMIVLASIVILLSRTTRTEALASANHLAQLRADAVARGAIEYVRAALRNSSGQMPAEGSLLVEAAQVGEGYFWLLRHDAPDTSAVAFGLTDEAGRLNINVAGASTLARLPRMTREIAAAIVDWRDPDDSATTGGAESGHYLALRAPYRAKNARFETVEELLLVRDVTPELLYGNDLNRNGALDDGDGDLRADAQADAAGPSAGMDQSWSSMGSASLGGSSGTMGGVERSLASWVTVWSTDPNLDSQGQRRVNVNTASPREIGSLLRETLSADRAAAVMTVIFAGQSRRVFRNVVDFHFQAGLRLNEFQTLADRLTISNARNRTGLVNVNTAPREVLAALPEMSDALAQTILSARLTAGGLTSPADLVRLLPREAAIALGDLVTFRSYACSADIVAVDASGRSFKRLVAVIVGRTDGAPRVVYTRDLTALGWPLDPQILLDLRAGPALSITAGRGQGAGLSSNTTGPR